MIIRGCSDLSLFRIRKHGLEISTRWKSITYINTLCYDQIDVMVMDIIMMDYLWTMVVYSCCIYSNQARARELAAYMYRQFNNL